MTDYINNVISHRVCSEMHSGGGKQEVMMDPATIALIAKISIKVIRLVRQCRNSESEIQSIINNPDPKDEGALKRVVRKELGWFKYLLIGAKVVRALKSVGSKMDRNELSLCGALPDESDNGYYGDPTTVPYRP
jgi:hypothetical protein